MKQLALPKALLTARIRQAPEPAPAEPPTRPADFPERLSKWLVCGLVVVSAAAMVWSTTHAARDCRFKPVALALGLDEQIAATVPRGMPCSVRTLIGDASVDDLTIEATARHGDLAPRGRTGIVYRPDPKFQGEDSFAFVLHGGAASAHAKSVVRVRVNVQ